MQIPSAARLTAATAAAAALWYVLRRIRVIRTKFVTLNDGTEIRVREACPGPDTKELFRFVELLAVHLDERHALHNTLENFARDFEAGKFEALLVEDDSGFVASAIFYEAYSTWDGPYIFLEDVYVLPSMRGKGVGSHLFRELAWRSAARGHRRLQWEALVANTAACGWYGDAIQAARKDEIVIWRLEESGIRRLCEM
jgi:GNAT superfamily N-acetyltransferase